MSEIKKEYKKASKKAGIYRITNLINGKYYIGSTREFKKRVKSYNKKHCHNKHLKAALIKHGEENFLFEVLETFEGTREELFELEQQYLNQIEDWNECYNFKKKTVSKERSCWSRTPEETAQIISEKSKKMWQNPGFKEKNSKKIKKSLNNLETKQSRSQQSKKMWQKTEHRTRLKKLMEPYREKQVETLAKHREEALIKAAEKNAKYYGKILDSDGVVHEIYNMQNFCKEHNIKHAASLKNLIKGKCPSYLGWRRYDERLVGVKYISDKHHRQRSFKLISPEGIVYEGINITNFCQKHNLRKENITAVVNGRRKSHKGWRLFDEQ